MLSLMREMSPMRMCDRMADRLPADFRKHMKAARREQLLAVRSLLDAMIGRLEREETTTKEAVEVKVE